MSSERVIHTTLGELMKNLQRKQEAQEPMADIQGLDPNSSNDKKRMGRPPVFKDERNRDRQEKIYAALAFKILYPEPHFDVITGGKNPVRQYGTLAELGRLLAVLGNSKKGRQGVKKAARHIIANALRGKRARVFLRSYRRMLLGKKPSGANATSLAGRLVTALNAYKKTYPSVTFPEILYAIELLRQKAVQEYSHSSNKLPSASPKEIEK